MKTITCCFTGHRRLPADKIEGIKKRLNDEIDDLYRQGVTEFISGGALGFDQIAASMIIAKKERGYQIRLIFALPCKNHDERWTLEQRRYYHELLWGADEVVYISEQYTSDCMKKRNFYMIDHSAFCLCALFYERSGTGQTARYAQQRGIKMINVAK